MEEANRREDAVLLMTHPALVRLLQQVSTEFNKQAQTFQQESLRNHRIQQVSTRLGIGSDQEVDLVALILLTSACHPCHESWPEADTCRIVDVVL